MPDQGLSKFKWTERAGETIPLRSQMAFAALLLNSRAMIKTVSSRIQEKGRTHQKDPLHSQAQKYPAF
jgi:hypothetical protein